MLKLTPQERRVYLVCCGFGNSAALPLLFANALFDTPAQLASMISGISFFLLGWSGVFWSLAYQLLATLPTDQESNAQEVKPQRPQSFLTKFLTILSRILSPPLIASFIGLGIGSLSAPLRTVIMKSPIFAALRTLGAGYGPTAVLVLAGSLARRVGNSAEKGDPSSGATLRVPRMSLGIAVTRFAIMPILGLTMIMFGRGKFFRTPMVQLALLLESIMPPAQNSTLILNMEGKQDAATAIARVLLVIYTFGIVPISIGLSIFLSVTGVVR